MNRHVSNVDGRAVVYEYSVGDVRGFYTRVGNGKVCTRSTHHNAIGGGYIAGSILANGSGRAGFLFNNVGKGSGAGSIGRAAGGQDSRCTAGQLYVIYEGDAVRANADATWSGGTGQRKIFNG